VIVKAKTITLCADDFGMNPGISQGILKLVRLQRLSAVSCMVNTPDFKLYAKSLLTLKDQVQTGLHFNLTEDYLLSDLERYGFKLNELLLKTHLGLINRQFIINEFNAQLDHFIQVMGTLPDFIDGHQHVHQFPTIRQIILRIYEQRLRRNKTIIRSTYPVLISSNSIKSRILSFTGGKNLSIQLKALKIPHNRYFSGVYNFARGTDYRALFRSWLALAQHGTLIMCHPGEVVTNKDAISHARYVELDYFLSDAFLADCQEYSVRLTASPKAG